MLRSETKKIYCKHQEFIFKGKIWLTCNHGLGQKDLCSVRCTSYPPFQQPEINKLERLCWIKERWLDVSIENFGGNKRYDILMTLIHSM